METNLSMMMLADPETVFRLAARVERWPDILPHYRSVRVLQTLDEHGLRRVVRMAAVRDVIPVQWTAVQEIRPEEKEIAFTHVGGVTRGMDVLWTLTPGSDGILVNIWHAFHPPWPVPDRWVHAVIGGFFVDTIAGRTLHQVKLLAEAEARGATRQ